MINYVKGDATNPPGPGRRLIVHICNDVGGWGKGFVVPLGNRWPLAEKAYREWHHYGRTSGTIFQRGEVQFVCVSPATLLEPESDVYVANMIAQAGYRKRYDDEPLQYVDYDALHRCLLRVAEYAVVNGMSVHMPRIGCGLGGGRWEEVEPIIEDTLVIAGVEVTVYDP